MDVITWFVPPSVLDDAQKPTRHKGIAKSLLAISLLASLMFFGFLFVRGSVSPAEYALAAVGICTPVLGALLIRATAEALLSLQYGPSSLAASPRWFCRYFSRISPC